MPFFSGNGTINGNGCFTLSSTANQLSPTSPTISDLSINNPTLLSPLSNNTTYTIIDPTSNSSGAFTYTSSVPTRISISGNTLTVLGVSGPVTITATQAATANYTSGSVSISCTVIITRTFWGNNVNGQLGTGIGGNTPYLPTDVSGPTNVTAIEIGTHGCLALDTNKNVWFWGNNYLGQLGNGGYSSNSFLPTQISGLINVTEIAISTNGCLALDTRQKVKFWGQNGNGQMGTGVTTGGNPAPTDVSGLNNITAIAIEQYGCLALDTSQNVWFWGNNTNGQLGDASSNSYKIPTQVSGLTNITAIAIGQYGCLALDASKNVWFWGYNTKGQLGSGASNTYYAATPVSGLTNITAIAISTNGCLALNTSQKVKFWGNNSTGQLGNTTTTPSICTPTDVSGLSNITSIAIGTNGCLATDVNQNIWFWGNNTNGQLGNVGWVSTSSRYYAPTLISGETNITTIAIGLNACLSLNTNQTVKAWGNNTNGQIGNGGSNNIYLTPTPFSGIDNPTAIAISSNGCVSLDARQKVKFWGRNSAGQVGNGLPSSVMYYAPIDVSGLSNITAIAIGQSGCLALDTRQKVKFWGNNGQGQLGTGVSTGNLTPTDVSGLSNISAIAISDTGCLALDNSNNVWFWGKNNNGQLGDASSNSYRIPTPVSGLSNITAIAIGQNGCLGLDMSKNVWFWGNNVQGQLGDASSNSYRLPTQVSGITNITAISIATVGCLALDMSQTVWFWGRNLASQVGNGVNTGTYYTPTKVLNITNNTFTAISINPNGCLALDTSKNVWFWGGNSQAQIGSGVTSGTFQPAKVPGLTNMNAIASDLYGCLTL